MSSHKSPNPLTRRAALRRMGNGFGMMAFAGMLGESLSKAGVDAGETGLGLAKLDYPQRVKRVIFLFMNGGLSGNAAWTSASFGLTWEKWPTTSAGFVPFIPKFPIMSLPA